MRTHHDASEPYEAQKQRAGLNVLTSSIGNLGWAILRSRPNKGLPARAKEHLAFLYEQGFDSDMDPWKWAFTSTTKLNKRETLSVTCSSL